MINQMYSRELIAKIAAWEKEFADYSASRLISLTMVIRDCRGMSAEERTAKIDAAREHNVKLAATLREEFIKVKPFPVK